ncbi:Com family DNA-binding transcriptional regulator [Acidovorax radicis]|uniref:Com family DNA-binding transcriptional regulator n=1 Tax=Acidovorax radicis TaxID=758826 RepID=UPI001CFADDE9|nr:Com family DNA-binding transcriptional regulator [Acidovorax radicis]UCV00713.1 Com family DNA-binding transcriptional regulator [Acidovorax radicis]
MNEIRCGSCRRKLGEGIFAQLSIKCPRCGTLNQFQSAPSAYSPERHASVEHLNISHDEKSKFPDLRTAQPQHDHQRRGQPFPG